MKLFIVKEGVPYEGDNIWLVAANNAEEAKATTGVKSFMNVSTQWVCNTNDYKEAQQIWTNT